MSTETSKIKALILEKPECYSTCQSIADSFGISYEALRKDFWRNEGITLGKWLTHAKVEYAKRLLRETELPCKLICYMVGLGRDDSGSKKFFRCVGLTMSEYRERCNGNSSRRLLKSTFGTKPTQD